MKTLPQLNSSAALLLSPPDFYYSKQWKHMRTKTNPQLKHKKTSFYSNSSGVCVVRSSTLKVWREVSSDMRPRVRGGFHFRSRNLNRTHAQSFSSLKLSKHPEIGSVSSSDHQLIIKILPSNQLYNKEKFNFILLLSDSNASSSKLLCFLDAFNQKSDLKKERKRLFY